MMGGGLVQRERRIGRVYLIERKGWKKGVGRLFLLFLWRRRFMILSMYWSNIVGLASRVRCVRKKIGGEISTGGRGRRGSGKIERLLPVRIRIYMDGKKRGKRKKAARSRRRKRAEFTSVRRCALSNVLKREIHTRGGIIFQPSVSTGASAFPTRPVPVVIGRRFPIESNPIADRQPMAIGELRTFIAFQYRQTR
jgi:hypothetical protein